MEKLKWCIQRTEENYKEVNNWANNNLLRAAFFDSGGYISYQSPEVYSITPDGYTEITIYEFRLLTNPERYNELSFVYIGTAKDLWTPLIIDKRYKEISSEVRSISGKVLDEWQRMYEKQSHYSANPEVTTTLDPITEYQTKRPDGSWSFDFAEESIHRKKAMMVKLNKAIKAQKKALKQLKELRDQLNAEVNY